MLKNEAANPFYRPLWVRVLLVASLAVWSAIEWYNGQAFWGILTGAAAVWAIWTFFVTYKPSGTSAPGKDGGDAPE